MNHELFRYRDAYKDLAAERDRYRKVVEAALELGLQPCDFVGAEPKPGLRRWCWIHGEYDRGDGCPGGNLLAAESRADRAESRVSQLEDVVEAVGKIHRSTKVEVYDWKCWTGQCDHDDCPTIEREVCAWCWNLWTQDGRDDEAPAEDETTWPCATAQALSLGENDD